MRIDEFIKHIGATNWEKFVILATGYANIGGWEGWLQTEWGMSLQSVDRSCIIEREYTYPDRRTRCDFYIAYNMQGSRKDETYIELKCINYKMAKPIEKAYQGFIDDIEKIRNNLGDSGELGNGFAVMVSYCMPCEIAELINSTNQVLKRGIPLGEVEVLQITFAGITNKKLLSELTTDRNQNICIFLYNP